jgi:CRISPR-associated endonuclease Cas2
MADYLIAYDITQPRRLAKVYRHLLKNAVPIEYSVFYATVDERRIDVIMAEAASMIDPKTDDLRCYPLPQRGLKIRLGRATLPAGIYYTGMPNQWIETS